MTEIGLNGLKRRENLSIDTNITSENKTKAILIGQILDLKRKRGLNDEEVLGNLFDILYEKSNQILIEVLNDLQRRL